jgi:hypothetical protein
MPHHCPKDLVFYLDNGAELAVLTEHATARAAAGSPAVF